MSLTRLTITKSAPGEPEHSRKHRLGFLALKIGLRFRLLLLITGVSLVAIWVSTALLFNFQRQQLIENTYTTASTLSSAVEISLQHAMVTADWPMVNDVVRAVASEKGVNSLRILDTQGYVGVSSTPAEVGQQIPMESPVCQNCHEGADIATEMDRTVIASAGAGSQALLSVNPIENQPQCHACHDPQQAVLGLLMIETPLTALNDQLVRGFWHSALLGLAAFTLLVGFLLPVLSRYLIRPVEDLARGVEEISSGNLDFQVEETHADELGTLARSFNSMRRQLKTSYENMEKREQELGILNEVGRAVTQLRKLQHILDFTLDTMMTEFEIQAGLIYLRDEGEQSCTLSASRGVSNEQIEKINQRRRAGMDIPLEVALSGEEVFIPNMALDPRFEGLWDPIEARSYANLPLMSRGIVVGVMTLITPAGRPFSHSDVEFFKAVGREVGIAIDNALLLASTRQREQQAITLQELGTKISASLALGEVLNAVAQSARELFNADIGLVGLADESRQEVVIRAASGTRADALKGERIILSENAPCCSLASGHPLLVEAYVPGQPMLHDLDSYQDEGIASFLAVPLLRGERFLGIIEVMTLQPRRFLQPDAQILLRLAQQVVVSIENAQLYQQLRFMATLEERDRLARELHDHLAQSLGYMNVKAAMTGDLMAGGKVEQAQESLLELKNVAKLVYTDVRESIFNLRTTISTSTGLLHSLEAYLAQYRAHYGVDAHLVIENEDRDEYSPEVAGQLLHIIQEALTNVRKHSAASRVWIRYDQTGCQVRITIEDNGQGFDLDRPAGNSGQHVGLNIMRERAESIGGRLVLDSQPGRGTRVIVTAPTDIEE